MIKISVAGNLSDRLKCLLFPQVNISAECMGSIDSLGVSQNYDKKVLKQSSEKNALQLSSEKKARIRSSET